MVRLPSHDVIHPSVSLLSCAESVVETVYATHLTSGEICGSLTFFTRYMSPSRRGRLAIAPWAPATEANPTTSNGAIERKRITVLLRLVGGETRSLIGAAHSVYGRTLPPVPFAAHSAHPVDPRPQLMGDCPLSPRF